MPDAIAIDFGTTRTKVAYWDERAQRPRLVRLGFGDEPLVPSLFYLPRDSEQVLWGYDAEALLDEDPVGIVEVLKRHLQDRYVYVNRRKISPQDLLTLMFRRLREQVGQEVLTFQNAPPANAYLTLPALYGPAVEKLLREAARAADFSEVELVPEPVAAARAWLIEAGETGRSVVVLDCGGGTLDLAYLGYDNGQFRIIPECPPGGDTHVGGHDVDRELLNLLRERVPEAAEELEQRQPFYLRQVRVLKERYCRGLPLRPLRVDGHTLELNTRDLQTVLEERFIAQTCENLNVYLARVVDLTGGEKPPVLLVGGSGRIRGLKEAIESQCDCQALWWERSEFATVLGAISSPGLEAAAVSAGKGAALQADAVKAKVMSETKEALLQGPKPGEVIRDELKDSTLGPEMVVVPEGRFQMGSPPGERERYYDKDPQHWVTISSPFAIGRHAVTFEEYDRFCEATGREKPDDGWYSLRRGEWPVINVSWDDAIAYCEWLSEQTGEQYSLPTEAQWEYACRASSETEYCFGDNKLRLGDFFGYNKQRLGDYAWYLRNSKGRTYPVEQKRANDWGLYDMHGNVWEWVRDWHGSYSTEPQQDPSGPEQGSYRVIRGGGWIIDAEGCRSACRGRDLPSYRGGDLGFRLARRV